MNIHRSVLQAEVLRCGEDIIAFAKFQQSIFHFTYRQRAMQGVFFFNIIVTFVQNTVTRIITHRIPRINEASVCGSFDFHLPQAGLYKIAEQLLVEKWLHMP